MTLEEKIKLLRKQLDEKTEIELTKAINELPDRIDQIIDKRINDIVARTLGMENRWGSWEVDHCNGRQTEIANRIGNIVTQKLGIHLDQWVLEATKQGTMPKDWKKALRKEFDEKVDWQLRTFIQNYAKSHIEQHAQGMLKKVIEAQPTQARTSKPTEPDYEDIED